MAGLSTVGRALDVLFHLHAVGESRGVTDIGRALDLPKATTHRLLRSLRQRALVEQDARGRYRLGIGLVALGLGALEGEPLTALARPELETTALALGETTFLVAARNGALTVLDKAESAGFLRASPRIGSIVPVHATAVGKVYLAFAPTLVTTGTLDRFTPRTATTEGRLARAVETTRSRGFGTNDEEWIAGLSVVAAPIQVHGQVRGAIAIAGSTVHVNALGIERVGHECRTVAMRIGKLLGGRPS